MVMASGRIESVTRSIIVISILIISFDLELIHASATQSRRQSQPPCQDQGVIFVSQPRDVKITCRDNDVAMFPCQYTGSNIHPQWMINSTLYSSLNLYLPPDHSYDNNILTVTNLRAKNGSLYQCVLLSPEECTYGSTVAQLICEDIEVQCLPHYHYENATLNDLMGINTIITQSDNFERVYNVTYLNSDSGDGCDSANLTCNHDGVCHHIFKTATSKCSHLSNITVIVSALTDAISPMPDPIRIDGTNNFVRIFITHTTFSCVFIDQPKDSEKFCVIKYAPTTLGCTNLTVDSYDIIASDSSYIEIPLARPDDGNICFVVVAGNGTQNVTIEGINSLTASSTQHYISESIMAASLVYLYVCLILLNIAG